MRKVSVNGIDRQKGSTLPAVLFALAIVILVVHVVLIFAFRQYAAPAPITANAREIDHQFHVTLWLTGVLFVFAQLGLAFAVLRFRDRGRPARFFPGNNALEIFWTSLAVVLFLGLGFLGRRAWAAVRYTGPPSGSIQIEVTGMQFQFVFRYPGPDGEFGRLDPALISADTGDFLGRDPASPEGRDDIVTTGTLAVPIDRPVELLIRSQDVIHSFFVRELRLQQDAVPGLVIPIHFTADKIGKYDIVCTQLCGLGHQKMHAVLDVMSESDYENFLRRQAAAQ
ncbi:MAG TPA: cytochrome c oxidase subunit II [Candidatus Acidoferrales bacterium]